MKTAKIATERSYVLSYNTGISSQHMKLLITIKERKNICAQYIIKLSTSLPQDVLDIAIMNGLEKQLDRIREERSLMSR